MKKIILAYFGTPDFSAQFLEKILKDKETPIEVTAIVTQPDKLVGRKQILTASPVKLTAQKHSTNLFDEPFERSKVAHLLSETDIALVFAFGEIIPKELLDKPKYGFWNIHPSLLPKYRGASPVAETLIGGEKETGVTIIQMDEKVDHGPIIVQEKTNILPQERRPELTKRLTDLAYDLFKNTIEEFIQQNYKVNLTEQDHSKATYTKLFAKNDGLIPLLDLKSKIVNQPDDLFNLFRGLYPWPGLWSQIKVKGKEQRLKITDVDLVDGKFTIKKVQLEGKKEVDFKQFQEAYGVF